MKLQKYVTNSKAHRNFSFNKTSVFDLWTRWGFHM